MRGFPLILLSRLDNTTPKGGKVAVKVIIFFLFNPKKYKILERSGTEFSLETISLFPERNIYSSVTTGRGFAFSLARGGERDCSQKCCYCKAILAYTSSNCRISLCRRRHRRRRRRCHNSSSWRSTATSRCFLSSMSRLPPPPPPQQQLLI